MGSRVLLHGIGIIFALIVGTACVVAALPQDCNHGGPCSCGELYNLDRCAGIGGNTCGCGPGFSGPSLGPTSDCSVSFPSNSCCLPTGETYASDCLGRQDGFACTSDGQCTSGACVNDVCGAQAGATAAPALSTVHQLLLMAGLVMAGWWSLRRYGRSA